MTWPNDHIFYSTDHKMLSFVLDTNELFHNSAQAYRAQHDLSRTVFNYKDTTPEKWILFANETDSSIQLDQRYISQRDMPHTTQRDINRSWDLIRTSILNAAKTSLPTKKIHSSFRSKFPESLSHIQTHLTTITNLLRNFSKQKITRTIYPSKGKLAQLKAHLPFLTKEYAHQDIPLPDNPSSFTKATMESLRTSLYQLKKTISTAFKLGHRKFEHEEIKKFIQKKADDFNGNQSVMIDSLLNRPRRKIVIDRVLSNDDLIIEPQEIKEVVNKHFQTCAGGVHHEERIPPNWLPRYAPIDQIDETWYNSLLTPPTFDEWMTHVRDSPNNKAAGTSGISYEMIKHLGPLTQQFLWKFVSEIGRAHV